MVSEWNEGDNSNEAEGPMLKAKGLMQNAAAYGAYSRVRLQVRPYKSVANAPNTRRIAMTLQA